MYPTFVRFARQAARGAIQTRSIPPTYPVIQKCPAPTCDCADLPAGLDIEREKPLNGTMPAHSEELLVMSGQSDWTSKIEDEKDTAPWGELVYNVKSILGKGGEYHDPYHAVGVGTCSFEPPAQNTSQHAAQALLFPSFQVVGQINTDHKSVTDFVRTFLLPLKLHAEHNSLPDEEQRRLTRDPSHAKSEQWAGKVRPISAPTIMVCSHHTRDSRCGVLGPLLHAEFTQYINKRLTLRNRPLVTDSSDQPAATDENETRSFASHPEFQANVVQEGQDGLHPINIGMMSHIGGHKWAGNVVVYIPPDYHCNPVERVSRGRNPQDSAPNSQEQKISEDARGDEIIDLTKSPLAGKTIWYGRVEPKHVEGIVEQTIGHGKIIGELFRGGVNSNGSYLRI